MPDTVERLNAALSGRYRIESELGEGGMATVYLADDLRHERKVALKVLRPELAAVVGADRFLAEIKTTANLQHPHILPLFDSGEADGFLFYVMPHIEGETLAERIEREHQLPVDEAVRIAVAVANALQAAHEKGVIHRDIKPGNILLSRGEPLVADFGIALAVGSAGGSRLTETGLSVGTPYYMSPEQATGDQNVGPASDTYALACVLYEMLVGDPPYVGSTAQAVLGKIIQGQPVSASETRKSVPANVDAAIRKALEKIPADRFREAKEFAGALGDPGFRHGAVQAATAGPTAGGWKRAAHGVLTLALAGFAAWTFLTPPPSSQPARFPLDVATHTGIPMAFGLAPDGSFLVFSTSLDSADGRPGLRLRRMGELGSVPIPGTEGAIMPSVSPDGTEVAYLTQADQSIRVVPLRGGVPRTIGAEAGCCPSWEADGYVYYSAVDGTVRRVLASGGDSEVLTPPAAEGVLDGFPNVTASGDVMIVTVISTNTGWRVDAVRLSNGERAVLMEGVGPARATASGHLVYADLAGRMVADRLNEKTLTLDGAPVEIATQVRSGVLAAFDISNEGTLVFAEAPLGGVRTQPVWVDRDGDVEVVDAEWAFDFSNLADNRGFALSPDGSKVATSVAGEDGVSSNIWIKQLPDGWFEPLTNTAGQATRPRWTPTGEAVSYLLGATGSFEARLQRADFVSPVADQISFTGGYAPFEFVFASDGEWAAARGISATSRSMDLLAVRLDGTEQHVAETPSTERAIALSPDGRWLAYESDESGRTQVYVRSFPDLNRSKAPVSASGGSEPLWGRTGDELFYINEAREMVSVAVEFGEELGIGDQTVLFAIRSDLVTANAGEYYALYDLDLDDQRFLMMRNLSVARASTSVIVLNLFDLLNNRNGN